MMIENPLFLIPVTSGLIIIIAGMILLKFPPKRINPLYGYRTVSSMKSPKRWVFAQVYSSKEMIKLGFLLTLSGLIGLKYDPGETAGIILGMGLLILMVIVLFIRVERAIKNKFAKGE